MRYRKKNKRRYSRKRTNKNTDISLKITNRNGSQINKNHKRVRINTHRRSGPRQYIFYAILNTDLHMNRGIATANIANGLMFLHAKLDSDQAKCQYIDNWTASGQRIIVLKGFNHKHLKYLEEELKFIAIGTHAVRQTWGRNRAIVALAVFGQKEDLEEIFEGLTYLR